MMVRSMGFAQQLHVAIVLFVRKPREQRQFQSKIDGPDAMAPPQLSQGRDLANPLGVEPLSLYIYYKFTLSARHHKSRAYF